MVIIHNKKGIKMKVFCGVSNNQELLFKDFELIKSDFCKLSDVQELYKNGNDYIAIFNTVGIRDVSNEFALKLLSQDINCNKLNVTCNKVLDCKLDRLFMEC